MIMAHTHTTRAREKIELIHKQLDIGYIIRSLLKNKELCKTIQVM